MSTASITTTSLVAATLVERLTGEGLIGMRAAAKLYGESRDGKTTHSSTVTRHALSGVKLPGGRVVKLECIRLGGKVCTSRAAVLRFFAAQNEPSEDQPADMLTSTPAASKRGASKASRELDAILGTTTA